MYDSDLSDEKIIWAKDEDKGKECKPTMKSLINRTLTERVQAKMNEDDIR